MISQKHNNMFLVGTAWSAKNFPQVFPVSYLSGKFVDVSVVLVCVFLIAFLWPVSHCVYFGAKVTFFWSFCYHTLPVKRFKARCNNYFIYLNNWKLLD